MKKTIYAVLLLLLGCTPGLFSQINIEGTLRLGDTTQLLLLKTMDGDQFVGYLQSWSVDEIAFVLQTNDSLKLKTSQVELIKVLDEKPLSDPIDPNKGSFVIYLESGNALEGQFISYNKRSIKIKHGGRQKRYFASNSVEEVVFEQGGVWNFENNFVMVLKNGDKLKGHLLHMDESSVRFQPYEGKPWDFARSQVYSINSMKSYRPMYGHRRALLLTPTGFNLRKGESEFRNIDYIHNSYAVGFSDNISGTFGLMGIEPYIQVKATYDFSKYIHVGAGGGLSFGGAVGWFATTTIGTPDYYFNVGYMENKGSLTFTDTDMDAIFFGGSLRVGNRQRLMGEFTHLSERRDMFDANGYGTNTFSFGYGWFSRRVSLNVGIMMVENSNEEFCSGNGGGTFFFGPCDRPEYFYSGIPVISTSIMFGNKFQ